MSKVLNASPKYATKPAPRAKHLLDRVEKVAEGLGTPLLPWQSSFVRVATELNRDGTYKRRTALATVPRQSGKTVVVSALAIDRMLATPDSYGIYVAQTRAAGTSRLRAMAKDLVRSGLDPDAKVTLGVGNERIRFGNGSIIEVQSPSEESTHGESIDLAVLDEAWAIDEVVLEGVLPAMSARPGAQLLMISTAGTLAHSHLLNHYCELGRSNPQGSIAYVEYSMPDDAHPFDEERWHEWMPALGLTVQAEHIADQMDKMDAGKFRRAFGNIPTATEGEAIPSDWWRDAAQSFPVPRGVIVAVDASYKGSSVAIAYQVDGRWHVDPWEWKDQPDAEWTISVVEALARYGPELLVVDPASLAGPALARLQELATNWGIPLEKVTLRDRALADQWFYEALRDGRVTHSNLPALEDAVQGAVTTSVGDLWRFDRRKSLVDVSPLVACSMAVYAGQEQEALAPTVAIW